MRYYSFNISTGVLKVFDENGPAYYKYSINLRNKIVRIEML